MTDEDLKKFRDFCAGERSPRIEIWPSFDGGNIEIRFFRYKKNCRMPKVYYLLSVPRGTKITRYEIENEE